ERVWSIASQVLDALTACHEAGVVHRDLKPANILIDGEQRVKLIDFGIAKLDSLEGLTATQAIIGTPEYMAPEQLRGDALDGRTDVYSLGIVIYEALCGKLPFKKETAIGTSFAHLTEDCVPLESHGVDAVWSAFVARAMSREPDSRFASAKAMRDALPT